MLPVMPVQAQTALTFNQSTQLQAYLNQAPTEVRTPSDTQSQINRAVMQAMNSLTPEQLAQTTAAPVAASDTPQAAGDTSTDDVAVKKKRKGMLAILDAPETTPGSLTFGLASGQGVAPVLPASAGFDHDAATAITAAFKSPGTTAESAATYAAAPVIDPAVEERIGLVRALYHIDGTEEIVHQFIATQHMKLIIAEVAKHIDFSKLSDSDKYRLAAIAAVAQTELEDKIIRMNALIQAQVLSKPELLQLLAAYDSDAQRKLTDMRLHDDGSVDRSAELDIRLAQYQIVKAFESKH
ncbi:MAG: hypothetical protein QM647_14860 [Asticcacaulis sp.]|uniref:hypothetical protein n=1 Tax=Asticcacaulis sp. TaxID=1872648 RepID=UPI0039E3FCCD